MFTQKYATKEGFPRDCQTPFKLNANQNATKHIFNLKREGFLSYCLSTHHQHTTTTTIALTITIAASGRAPPRATTSLWLPPLMRITPSTVLKRWRDATGNWSLKPGTKTSHRSPSARLRKPTISP